MKTNAKNLIFIIFIFAFIASYSTSVSSFMKPKSTPIRGQMNQSYVEHALPVRQEFDQWNPFFEGHMSSESVKKDTNPVQTAWARSF